jgi:hypothetical protein
MIPPYGHEPEGIFSSFFQAVRRACCLLLRMAMIYHRQELFVLLSGVLVPPLNYIQAPGEAEGRPLQAKEPYGDKKPYTDLNLAGGEPA